MVENWWSGRCSGGAPRGVGVQVSSLHACRLQLLPNPVHWVAVRASAMVVTSSRIHVGAWIVLTWSVGGGVQPGD